VRTVQEKLLRAFEQTRPRMSVGKLTQLSGLEVDRSSMSRKIRGKAPMSVDEAQAVARVLGLRVVVRAVRRAA
jgi:hypothetical protein